MRRTGFRDLARRTGFGDIAVMLAALAGFHAVFVWFPARLARETPSPRILPITAPDFATLVRDDPRGGAGWFGRGTGAAQIPASPIRP